MHPDSPALRPPSRRDFLTTLAVGTIAALSPVGAATERTSRHLFLGFSKPFTHLNPEQTADLVAGVGWDGIDCPVRATASHVKPERVEADLPPLIEALKRRGKVIPIITTDITRLDARAEKVLRTISRLGIKNYRFGFVRYSKQRPPTDTLRDFSAALKDLSAINRELGLRGGYQNHSGTDYLGATIWELWDAMKDLDANTVGLCYDIGQAMVEGGLSWPSQVRLLQNRWLAIQVKDFFWKNQPPKGWDVEWGPLGCGRVTKPVLESIGARTFAGPVIQHHEHLEPGKPVAELLPALRTEFATLKQWLA